MLLPGDMQKIFDKINPVLEALNERIAELEKQAKAEKAPQAQRAKTASKGVDKSS